MFVAKNVFSTKNKLGTTPTATAKKVDIEKANIRFC